MKIAVPATLLKGVTVFNTVYRLYTVKFEISSFLLLSSVWTLRRENSLSCLSSGQQLSYENAPPSALTASVPFLLVFYIFPVPDCRLLELLTLLLRKLGWELKPQVFLFPAPVRDVFSHLVTGLVNAVDLWFKYASRSISTMTLDIQEIYLIAILAVAKLLVYF